uniref:Uncharacterized protein n=1 Tax=Anguilla anguilla TaxID=7936 RepID=A0A0E9PJL1_ANGAN
MFHRKLKPRFHRRNFNPETRNLLRNSVHFDCRN